LFVFVFFDVFVAKKQHLVQKFPKNLGKSMNTLLKLTTPTHFFHLQTVLTIDKKKTFLTSSLAPLRGTYSVFPIDLIGEWEGTSTNAAGFCVTKISGKFCISKKKIKTHC
jgi:hypothetical protein